MHDCREISEASLHHVRVATAASVQPSLNDVRDESAQPSADVVGLDDALKVFDTLLSFPFLSLFDTLHYGRRAAFQANDLELNLARKPDGSWCPIEESLDVLKNRPQCAVVHEADLPVALVAKTQVFWPRFCRRQRRRHPLSGPSWRR